MGLFDLMGDIAEELGWYHRDSDAVKNLKKQANHIGGLIGWAQTVGKGSWDSQASAIPLVSPGSSFSESTRPFKHAFDAAVKELGYEKAFETAVNQTAWQIDAQLERWRVVNPPFKSMGSLAPVPDLANIRTNTKRMREGRRLRAHDQAKEAITRILQFWSERSDFG